MVKSPEGRFLANFSNHGETAVNKREFKVSSLIFLRDEKARLEAGFCLSTIVHLEITPEVSSNVLHSFELN